jgi:hypothetical protein
MTPKAVCTNDPIRPGIGRPPPCPKPALDRHINEPGFFDQAHFIQECRAFARFARARGQGGDENDAAQTGIITAGTASGPMAWFGKIIAISPIWVRRTYPRGP